MDFIKHSIYQKCLLVTGPNIDIAIKLIKRMKGLFEPKLGPTFETVIELNGCIIKAFPSNDIDAYRALDNPKFILLEALSISFVIHTLSNLLNFIA